jgi:hypothetical protein
MKGHQTGRTAEIPSAASVALPDYQGYRTGENWGPAFAAAITDVTDKGGGWVTVPPGEYHSGTIVLESGVGLHLEPGARIVGSTDLQDYRSETWGHNRDRTSWHLISATDCDNVAIEGEGTIDGSGPAFWEDDPEREDYPGGFVRAYKERRPSPMVEFSRCNNVRVRGVTLTRSPGWTLHCHDCNRVEIDGITIRNSRWGPNTDGIDLTGVHGVTVSGCDIDTGDDAVCLKTTSDSRDVSDVVVSDCRIRTYCVGLKLGCVESVRDMRDIHFRDCHVTESSRLVGMYSYRGGRIENVQVERIEGDTRAPLIQNRPIHIEARIDRPDENQPDAFVHDLQARPPYIRNVTVEGFEAETDGRVMVVASDGLDISELRLRRLQLRYPYVYNASLTADEAASRQFAQKAREARRALAAVVMDGHVSASLEDLRVFWPHGTTSWEDVPASWRFSRKFENGSFSTGFEVGDADQSEHAHLLWLHNGVVLDVVDTEATAFGEVARVHCDTFSRWSETENPGS